MEIYLVRHGETDGNVARRHQVENTPLTPVGKQQALIAAETIKKLRPTHLITSTLVRAVETASIIGGACDLTPQTDSKFIEIVRPKYLYGYHHRSLQSLWFYFWWYLGKDSPVVAEGESYRALRERIGLAKKHLSDYPEDARVVVVSHAVFISMFVAHICRHRALSPWRAALTFLKILTMSNGRITTITYNATKDSSHCPWSIPNW